MVEGSGGSGGGTGKRVLIAEDQTGMRGLVRWLVDLEDDLTVAAEATTGQEALEAAVAVRPDAVVLDLGLPVIDGEDVLPALRAQLPAARIVVLSGQASAIIQPRLIELGADAVVEKDSAAPGWQTELLAQLRLAHSPT